MERSQIGHCPEGDKGVEFQEFWRREAADEQFRRGERGVDTPLPAEQAYINAAVALAALELECQTQRGCTSGRIMRGNHPFVCKVEGRINRAIREHTELIEAAEEATPDFDDEVLDEMERGLSPEESSPYCTEGVSIFDAYDEAKDRERQTKPLGIGPAAAELALHRAHLAAMMRGNYILNKLMMSAIFTCNGCQADPNVGGRPRYYGKRICPTKAILKELMAGAPPLPDIP